MGTQIKLQTCFAPTGTDAEMLTLPEGIETVGDLLNYMGRQADFHFIEPGSGALEEELEVILNHKEIWFYPETLGTPLRDGDIVEVYLLPLGGG